MEKISSEGRKAPALFEGINVNHCKNPKCANFGMPETPDRGRRAKGSPAQQGDYMISSSGKGKPLLKCLLCGETLPLRSNQGVHEELMRLSRYLETPPDPCCKNTACALFTVPAPLAGDLYVQYGKSAAGTPRYRCGACMKTFSGAGKSTKKHRKPHKNRDVFALLISQMALRKMSWFTGLDRQSIYGKIEFLYNQCQGFAADRERKLLEGMPLPKLYLATDRQTLAVNWTKRKDRRNVMLQAIATADLTSGFVFGMDLNFDASLDTDEVEADAAVIGDFAKLQHLRKYARLWLQGDYDVAVEAGAERKAAKKKAQAVYSEDQLAAEIANQYVDANLREDVEEVITLDKNEKLPATGVEVRDQYTVYAHFLLLERLVGHASKIRCYMDLDSGFRAGFMAAFHKQVKERRADAWFVRVMKESTIDQKDAAVQKAKKRLKETMAAMSSTNPDLKQHHAEVFMALEEMDRMSQVGKWDDRWLTHPVPNMAEPDKRVCWLTDIGLPASEGEDDYGQRQHAARLYLKASLHAVDRFFMQIRRGIRLAERPIATATTDRRMWHGYAAYQPRNLAMALTIYKVAYNYCLTGADGKTPAMRLGLAKAPIELEDIVYFSP